MTATTKTLFAVFLTAAFAGAATSTGASPNIYTVKAPEIAIPSGATLGHVRRVIQPFENWTLICDENIQAQTRVCNVTETLVDRDGFTIFSWTLAATEDGAPLFILRAPHTVGSAGLIKVQFPNVKEKAVSIRACDDKVCVGTLLLDSGMRRQIATGELVKISFEAGQSIKLDAPLAGLTAAVEAIE
ncbi:invasion associated locus B family protein [Mesorhizobium sp. 10J20-29]